MSGRNGTTGNRVGSNSPRGFESLPFRQLFSIPSRRLWILGGLTAASLLILACAPAQYLGRQQDDLLYLVAAESLLKGHGLRNLWLPGQPAMTSVNLVFPLLLSPIVWLARGRYEWVQAFCALLWASAPWSVWLYLRRKLDEVPAALAALVCATSPFVLSQAGCVMSEAVFLPLSLAALAAAEAQETAAASTLLLALSQLRQAGLALLPAACAPALRRNKGWRAAAMAAPALAGWLAWTLWSRAQAGGAQKLDELALSYSAAGLSRLGAVAWDNLRFYVAEWGSCLLPRSLGSGPAGLAAGVLLATLVLFGMLRRLRREPGEAAAWALLGVAALHLLWPWQYERYLIMPLPLLCLALAWALGRRASAALAALLAAQLVFHAPIWLGGTNWKRPELEKTYAAARAAAKPGEVLASALFLRDGFLSGLPSLPLPPATSAKALAFALEREGAGLVLWQDGLDLGLSLDRTAVVRAELDADRRFLDDAGAFSLVFAEPREGARLYRLR